MIKWVSTIILIAVVPTMICALNVVVFQPDEDGNDAYVDYYYRYDNFGQSEMLGIGEYHGNMPIVTYLQFTELDDYIGEIDLIGAYMSIYIYDNHINPPKMWCHLYRAKEEWSEDDITWDNQPDYEGDSIVSFIYPDNSEWKDIIVTEIVRLWVEEEYDHYGFYIFGSAEADEYVLFYSSEGEFKPKLTIEFYYTDIEPTSLGEIKSLMK